jgi:RND family efflux transporter MFP subunit
MNFKILIGALWVIAVASCNPSAETENQDEREAIKFQYTSYTNDFELFAEADAFIVGETANVLSHFSMLPSFKAVEKGKIAITLSVNGKVSKQILDKPTRKGIYSFDIKPATQGKGTLTFEITNDKGSYEVIVPEVTVFASDAEAVEASKKVVISRTNTTVFTKEQSWKIDFSTNLANTEPFGQVIKTTALVQSSQGSEMVVTAKTNGIVVLTENNMLEGRDVTTGQALFSISGNNLADNNISVKYAGAKSNYEKANADYERAKELAKDKIVSQKDLLSAKNQYDNAKAVYDNLNRNFNASGQKVTSPITGFVKQVFVKNGSYVEAGQPIVTISQNKTLVLKAELPQKYANVLGNIKSANIRSINDNQSYTFEQLNGKILSYGKAANSDNFLIPVNIQIDNKGNFTAGSFVEIYLKTLTNNQAITVPNAALLEEQGNFYVWVQVTPELFEKREITAGKTDGVSTEIIKGISTNERIVTRGAMLIKLAQATGTLDAHSGHVH